MLRLASLGLALACTLPTVALAQEPPSDNDVDNARRHYEAGVSYYEGLRYEDAAREFREAFRLSGRAHLLKNVATSLQHSRHWTEAADAYAEYLERTPDAEDREGVEVRIRRLRELAASEERGEETGDDEIPEAMPLESEEGSSVRSDASGGGVPVVPVVLLGTGAALGIGALVVGLLAHGAYTDLDTMCTGGVCNPALAARRDEGEALAITSTVLTGAAIVAGAMGIVLWVLDGGGGGDDDTAPATNVSAWVDGDGLGLVVSGEL